MVRIYGEARLKNAPSESLEMATFFSRLRRVYPDSYGSLAIHVRNEGKRSFSEINKMKIEGGWVKGTPDIIIPGAPSFLCELKSMKIGSKASKEQIMYLESAISIGAFACIAYGHEAAWEAFKEWVSMTK